MQQHVTAIRYLSEAEVERLAPSPGEAVDIAGRALRAVASGRVQLGHDGLRPRATTGLSAMTGYVEDVDLVGQKWVRESASGGITATILLNDPETGFLHAIMGARYLTGVRTAAVSGACVAALGPPGPVAIIGTGLQARSHLSVLDALGRRDVRVSFRRWESADALVRWAELHVPDAALELFPSPRAAVEGAAVVITMVTRGSTTGRVEGAWLRDDALVLPIDFAHCIDGATASGADLVAADDPAAYESFRKHGELPGFPAPRIPTGAALDHPRPPGRVVVVNVGNAAGDLYFADAVRRAAEEAGVGVLLDP